MKIAFKSLCVDRSGVVGGSGSTNKNLVKIHILFEINDLYQITYH